MLLSKEFILITVEVMQYRVPNGTKSQTQSGNVFILHHCYAIIILYTRNELALLAHSFYTCLKHHLMHQLYSSALPWIRGCIYICRLIYLMRIFENFAPGCAYVHVHILADHVTSPIRWSEKLVSCLAASLAKAPKRRRLE